MTLIVHTARVSYKGADRFDITRGGRASVEGLLFAPSWSILSPAIEARRAVVELRTIAAGDSEVAGWAGDEAHLLLTESWATYTKRYRAEMRASYLRHRAVWSRLLARESVTLVCFCNLAEWPGMCHRLLLAEMLAKCGATSAGEL